MSRRHCVDPRSNAYAPWKGSRKQGDSGFQLEVYRNLELNCLVPGAPGFTFVCSKRTEGSEVVPFPYQRVLACLLRPQTPVNRALVVWKTGSGKTWAMVRVLDNNFDDPRPKVLLFPEDTVAKNFYVEFMEYPSKFRRFVTKYMEGPNYAGGKNFVQSRPQLAKWSCPVCKMANAKAYQCKKCGALHAAGLEEVRNVLALKGPLLQHAGKQGFPTAPVRAMSYTVAGGTRAADRSFPILKFAQRVSKSTSSNPYNGCVVLCDEAHTLLKPAERSDLTQKRVQLGKWLSTARCTFYALTATPIPDFSKAEEQYGRLMRIVKGPGAPASNRGYILFYNFLTPGLFPATIPDLNACQCLGNVVPVPLQGVNMITYLEKNAQLTKGKGLEKASVQTVAKLLNYCNMSTYYQRAMHTDFKNTLVLNPASHATKLARLVQDVSSRPQEKTLVVLHRTSGFKGLVQTLGALFNQAGVKWGALYDDDEAWTGHGKNTEHHLKKGASSKVKDEFNVFDPKQDVKYGAGSGKGKIRVLVIDAKTYSEGVSFFGVRRIVLLDCPTTYSAYLQRIGRVLRACRSHILNLEKSNRTVAIDFYVAVVVKSAAQRLLHALVSSGKKRFAKLKIPEDTVDLFSLRKLETDRKVVQAFMKSRFAEIALDAGLYDGAFKPSGPIGTEQKTRSKSKSKSKSRSRSRSRSRSNSRSRSRSNSRSRSRSRSRSNSHSRSRSRSRSKSRSRGKGKKKKGLLGFGGTWKTLWMGGGR